MRIKFTVGDWSRDGHNMFDSYLVDVNLTKPELDKAFHDGCIFMGLDEKQCNSTQFLFCQDYQDYMIPEDFVEKMIKAGLDPDNYFGSDYRDESTRTGDPSLLHFLWLDIAKLGNSSLAYEECEAEATYRIGGYGLYSS